MDHGEGRIPMRSDCSRESGFTFVEVIIAVMLLAIATTTLVGLESSAVQRTLQDRNTQQGMLAARRLISLIEANPDDPMRGNHFQGKVKDVLSQLGGADISDDAAKEILEPLDANIEIEELEIPIPIPVPNAAPLKMKKVALSISWGPSPNDTFSILYFFSNT
jgi:prepilin-type N-terminal cleavage/methylation domain-containing protein